MTDSREILSVTDRVTDANGVPVSGAKLKFFEAGTTTPRPVYADKELTTALGATAYCDSAGYPVTSEGGTTKTSIYTGIGDFKLEVTDEDDVVVIAARDDLPGALDTSGFTGSGEVDQSVPVVAKSASYTVLVADNGKLFDVNCSGGSATMTLPSAVDAGDGFYVGFRHNGTANAVIPATVSSQKIRHAANTGALALPTKVALTGKGETLWLASDGADWVAYNYVPSLINNATGVIAIADRLSAPPSHVAGARYILTSAPSGAWSTFSEHDIAESDGTAWFKRTPPTDCGWLAYVQDEDRTYQFRGSAWVQQVAEVAAQSDMETATSLVLAVPPGMQKFHPLHAKAWIKCDAAGNISASSGVASISDDGQGIITITWSTAFSSANYVVVVTLTSGSARVFRITGQTTTTVTITVENLSAGNADPGSYHVAAFGDL